MEAWLHVIGGLIMLLLGAEALVRSAVAVALRLHISPSVVGLTIVAVGTSLPELVISLQDTLTGSGGIAVGGILGSNVFNIGAILGLSAIIYPVAIESRTLRLEYPFMIGAAGVLAFVARDGTVDRQEGMALFAIAVAFTGFLLMRVRFANAARRAAQAAEVAEERQIGGLPMIVILALLVIGVGLLHFGSDFALLGGRRLAVRWGWSDHLIGLTLVAFGTSAPELAVSAVAAFQKRTEIAIGNIIGSCIFNVTLVLGLVAGIEPLSIAPRALDWDIWWVIGLSVLMLPLMVKGKSLGRADGFLLVAAFSVYYALLFIR